MAETDHSFFDNFSDHLQSTVGQQAQGLSQLKIENAKMNSNKNLSGETKSVANVLDAVAASIQKNISSSYFFHQILTYKGKFF